MDEEWDNDELREEDFEFDDEDMVKNHRLPLSKEQVVAAFLELNNSGKNYVFNKIKELKSL